MTDLDQPFVPATRRLTDLERADRKLTEREFQGLVTELAGLMGYRWVHFRAARTDRGWRVPVEGPLGAGWPDLVLVSPHKRRTLAVELKREIAGPPTPDQEYVHLMLRESGWTVFVWRPSDLTSGRIQEALS